MAHYTKKNLQTEVDDAAKKSGLAGQEMHSARTDLELSHAGMSYQKFAPNHTIRFGHRHSEQEEVYVVIRGGGQIKIEDEVVELGEYDAVRVAPTAVRAMRSGADGIEFLAFGARIGDGDKAEMLPDWWKS